jgi:hypothetical protein
MVMIKFAPPKLFRHVYKNELYSAQMGSITSGQKIQRVCNSLEIQAALGFEFHSGPLHFPPSC